MDQINERQLIPDYIFGNPEKCTYCGEKSESIDHVIAVAFFDGKRTRLAKKNMKGKGLRTYSCMECNTVLNDLYFESFKDRCLYINQKLQNRYRKIIALPEWMNHEKEELGKNFKERICGKLSKKMVILERIRWQNTLEFQQIMEEPMKEFSKDKRVVNLEWMREYFLCENYQVSCKYDKKTKPLIWKDPYRKKKPRVRSCNFYIKVFNLVENGAPFEVVAWTSDFFTETKTIKRYMFRSEKFNKTFVGTRTHFSYFVKNNNFAADEKDTIRATKLNQPLKNWTYDLIQDNQIIKIDKTQKSRGRPAIHEKINQQILQFIEQNKHPKQIGLQLGVSAAYVYKIKKQASEYSYGL